jgi:hypothetical protein
MSNNLLQIGDWAKKVLLNKEVIAVDQDPMGVIVTISELQLDILQGREVFADNKRQVWAR